VSPLDGLRLFLLRFSVDSGTGLVAVDPA
jgi:hypothetical protein